MAHMQIERHCQAYLMSEAKRILGLYFVVSDLCRLNVVEMRPFPEMMVALVP